jgi:GR25 family glycosyltransferase involved in LPS biosynthesis
MIPAKMIRTASDLVENGIQIQADFFWALSNRFMSLPEIGCAYSHNIARREISQTKFGGVIFEDDARIINQDLLFETVRTFLTKHQNQSAMLSLTYSVHREPQTEDSSVRGYFKLFGDAPLAVAYALTPRAAKRLLDANDPVRFVSDWPEVHVKKYCPFNPLVSHGDSETLSVIDPLGLLARNKRQGNLSIRKLMLLDFLFRARGHISFSDYFKYAFLKSAKFRLDAVRMKFVKRFFSQ